VVLKFVEYPEFAIDISTVTTPAANPSINVTKEVGQGTYTDDILYAGFVEEIGTWLADIMEGLGALEIPVGDTVTTFEGTLTRNNFFTDYQDQTFTAKVDFGDFDLDGDGNTEGCSGHTNTLPICARVWLDGQRYLAWIFEEYPTATNPGKSRFRIQYEFIFIQDTQLTVAMEFDQRDPENKYIDGRSGLIILNNPPNPIQDKVGLYVSQVGPDASAIKQINLAEFGQPQDPLRLMQWKEGSDRWSGSIVNNYTDICVKLSTAEELPPGETPTCSDLGISVAGIPFLTLHDDSVVQFHDFPLSPTF
jgi:hypothetical protein